MNSQSQTSIRWNASSWSSQSQTSTRWSHSQWWSRPRWTANHKLVLDEMVHLDLVEHPMKKLGLDLVDHLDLVDYLDNRWRWSKFFLQRNKLGLSWAKLSTAGIELNWVVGVWANHESCALFTSNTPKFPTYGIVIIGHIPNTHIEGVHMGVILVDWL